jgi:hypothetical protein
MAKGTASSSSAQKRITQLKEEQALLQEGSVAWKKIEATIEQIEKRLTNSLSNMEDFSDSVASLGQFIGKNNKLFETMNILADDMSLSMDSIAQAMKHDLLNGASKFKKEVFKTADAYKNFGNTVATSTKKLIRQQITTSQYNQSVLDGYEDLEEQIDRVEASIESLTGQSKQFAKETLNQLKNAKERTAEFAANAEKSKKNLEGMGFAIDTVASTGIPAMNELGGVIKAAAEGGVGLTLAFAAMGAALGKMAYDLGFFGDKLGTIASYDKKLAGLKGQIDAINQQVTLGIFGGRNFVKESAILDFSNTVAQMGIEFEAASKTALFGEKLGGVGYGAAQLQMAGIAAETIATAMKDASSAMGSNVSGEFGADMAILAARTGQTSEGIASITDTFMRLGNVSAETAINLQEGLRTMAKQANVNLGALMEDVAEASKDALSYQLKSPAALAKAATFAASLGTKFTDIANAGKNMVLNYKDSIKAEMSLSAMLGKRVDLSQVRALFAAGRTEDAIKALKAQGLDPSKMNLFQQEALKNATGGLDLNSLQKIATRTGRTGGELEGEKVKVGNGTFILSKNAAESAKAVGSAVASAMTAVQQTLLESDAEKARQTAIENNTQGLKDLMNSLNRTEMMKSIATGIGAAIPMLIGAVVMGIMGPRMLGKAMATALKNAGIGGAGAASAGAAGAAGSQFAGLKMVGKHGNVHNAAGKFVSKATADAFKASQGYVASKGGVYYKPGSPQANAIMAARPGGGLPMSTPAGATSALSGVTAAGTSVLSGAKPAFGARVGSNLKGGVRGMGGALTALFAAYDYKQRKDAGQTTLQAGAGAGGGAAGGLAGAAIGAAISGPLAPIGALVGGMVGYFGGSSIADSLTGANEPMVESQQNTELALTEGQLAQAKASGDLLSDTAYTIELQKEMVAELGLATTLLYEIADYNARGLFQSVNIDGKKVMEALASTSRKQFGVARNYATPTVAARK